VAVEIGALPRNGNDVTEGTGTELSSRLWLSSKCLLSPSTNHLQQEAIRGNMNDDGKPSPAHYELHTNKRKQHIYST
jgi:hypothetical protein